MSQKKKEAKTNTAYHGQTELRRGPWTIEEDSLLIHYIASHGEGRWNLLARCSGLKRTGKSCRLRWLNYLKPDVKRGNLSPEEQFMILDLHSKWGNRWSRIAQYLPGRTDNEIKNYWRTRVQKQARQLKIDTSSAMFQDAVRTYWMPRLLEKMASTKISAIELPFSSKHTALTTQPAHFNPPLLPQHHFHQVNPTIYSAELVQNAPGAFNIGPSTNVNVVTDVIGNMNNGYGDDSLGLASCSTGVSDSSSSELVDHLGSDVWMDELLSLDDLWHFRKQDEWCGLVL